MTSPLSSSTTGQREKRFWARRRSTSSRPAAAESRHTRLHGTITAGPGYTTPATVEDAYYRHTNPATELVTQ